MKFKKFSIEVLNSTDVTKEAWITSKPTIKYESEEELNNSLGKILNQDTPLSAFKHFDLKIESSLLFRDLLLSIRPCIAWASSFRITPITEDYIAFEDCNLLPIDQAFVEAGYDQLFNRFKDGEKLDNLKLDLYLGTMTQYVVSIDSRTLMVLAATLMEVDPKGFKHHVSRICEILGYNSFEELPKNPTNSIFDKLSIGDDTDYLEKLPTADYNISDYKEFEGFGSLTVIVNAAIGAEFIRQHFSFIKSQLWDRVHSIGYINTMILPCSAKFKYISVGPKENFARLIQRRSCWAATWDKQYSRGAGRESWADILEPLIKDFTEKEFLSILPCKCNFKNCPIKAETELRLYKEKGVKGVTPDDNPPCPIAIGDPEQVARRGDFYGSDSIIYDKWKELVEFGALKKRETDWKIQNEK